MHGRRNLGIMERSSQVRDEIEVRVVDLDGATGIVGGIEESLAADGSQGYPAIVSPGVVDGHDRVVQIHARTPPRDDAVIGGEQEDARAGQDFSIDGFRDVESRTGSVEHVAIGKADGTRRTTGYGNDE